MRLHPENSWTLYFHSIPIRNDAVPYALLTSLFARLAFNTGEDLYCVHGSELLPIQDRRHFKNGLKNNLSSYVALRCKHLLQEHAPSPLPPPDYKRNKKKKKKKKRVQCPGVVCDLAAPLKFKILSETWTYSYNMYSKYIFSKMAATPLPSFLCYRSLPLLPDSYGRLKCCCGNWFWCNSFIIMGTKPSLTSLPGWLELRCLHHCWTFKL